MLASLITAASKLGGTLEHEAAWQGVKVWLTTLPWVMTGSAFGARRGMMRRGAKRLSR